jgi:hypothetical protein
MHAARQSSSITSDRIVIRQHAEAAASQAFMRAKPAESLACPDYRPAPPMLARRRSQVTGRSEGSHLEEARLGRRRSSVRRDENKSTPLARQRPRSELVTTTSNASEIRNKRATSVQQQLTARPAVPKEGSVPRVGGYQRNTLVAYANGSPSARSSATSQVQSSSTMPTPRHTEKSYDDGISVNYREPQSYAHRTKANPRFQSQRVSIRETQTDEEIIALARDRQLQDPQQRKVRERKSFLGTMQMLQRRRLTSNPPGITYDSSLPPFNYADDSLLAPLPPSHDFTLPASSLKTDARTERQPRGFSTSIKGQFKKLLRKASRAPAGLTALYAEASATHGTVETDDAIDLQTSSVLHDPFVDHGSPSHLHKKPVALFDPSSNNSNPSVGGESAGDRSRVTSWTNSTTVGTSSTCANTASTSVADEHGRILGSNSNPVLRKKGSFFGRAVQTRLRKSSRAELKSSGESQALFTALRERMLPHNESRDHAESDECTASRATSALSTLPSQKRAGSLTSSTHERTATIRTVSPDLEAFCVQTMSPVVEASPEHDRAHDDRGDQTPTAVHYGSRSESMPAQAARPSQERIARRVQQSQARWKGALHAASTASDGKVVSAYDDDNPYELPSVHLHPHTDHGTDTGGLPQHARVSAPAIGRYDGLLSPGVYSCATNGESPQPVTPEQSSTKITVTSREIKRYDISPSKKGIGPAQRPVQASSEWRKWLSDEMNNLTSQHEDDYPNMHQKSQACVATSVGEFVGRDRAGTTGSSSRRKSADTPISDQASKARRDSRPRANSRRSSYMNERYPIIESSDSSSRRTSRKFSMVSNAGTDTEHSLRVPGSDDSRQSAKGTVTSRKTESDKILLKRHSIANVEHISQSKIASRPTVADDSVPDKFVMSGAIPDQDPISAGHSQQPSPTHHKHKSAFDLRAKYKSTVMGTSRPVEVRRKSTAPFSIAVFEDNTIQNISAGPYANPLASTASANKENTPPHVVDDGGLPAVSSSEWLAGPTSKKRDAKTTTKASPPKSRSLTRGVREGSPGQRMVTGWLEGRKGKGSDGEMAFV